MPRGKVPTKSDALDVAFMLVLYTGVFLYASTVNEPITMATFALLLIILALGSLVIYVKRANFESKLLKLLEQYNREYNDSEE